MLASSDFGAQSTTAWVVAAVEEEPFSSDRPCIPPPPSEPAFRGILAGLVSHQERDLWDAEQAVDASMGGAGPDGLARCSLAVLAQRLGRQPNADERRALMTYLRSTASEIAALSGGLAVQR